LPEAADAEKAIKNWGYNSVLQKMREHAQWLRELVLAFIDRDLHGRRRAENGFGSTRRSRSFLVQGHGRMLMNDLRFAFESSGDGCGLQKTVDGGGKRRKRERKRKRRRRQRRRRRIRRRIRRMKWRRGRRRQLQVLENFSPGLKKRNDLNIFKLEHMFGP
jgi:hypothetical protein